MIFGGTEGIDQFLNIIVRKYPAIIMYTTERNQVDTGIFIND